MAYLLQPISLHWSHAIDSNFFNSSPSGTPCHAVLSFLPRLQPVTGSRSFCVIATVAQAVQELGFVRYFSQGLSYQSLPLVYL